MANGEKFMPFFYDWSRPFEALGGDECKALLLAMVRYHKEGTEPPEFEGLANMAATFVFPQLERAKEVSRARAEAGSRGGRAGRKQTEANASKPKQTKATKTNTNTNTTTNTNTNTTTNTTDPSRDRPFDEFWTCYPKKVGKEAARKAWAKLSPDDALCDTILSAVEAQKRSPQWCRDGGQFIPNPSTWLNEKRWEDQLTISAEPAHANGSFDTDDFFEAALAKSLSEYIV